MLTSESLRQMDVSNVYTRKPQAKAQITSARRKCLRQNGIFSWKHQKASGKTAFPVGNSKLPQAKRHFQLETVNCLRQNDISSEKQRFA